MSYVFLKKLVIETTAPLAIRSGEREILSNDSLATDWNGLPYIPATALAGVWRSLVKDSTDYWFGDSRSDSKKNNSRVASRITISDGLLLNSKSKLPNGTATLDSSKLVTLENLKKDSLYERILSLQKFERDHCRIDMFGGAKDKSKYKSTHLPRGLRFLINFRADVVAKEEIATLENIFKYLNARGFALGSRTSDGNGTFKLIGEDKLLVDLESEKDQAPEAIRKFMSDEKIPLTILDASLDKTGIEDNYLIPEGWSFRLKSEGTWRIGTGKHDSTALSRNSRYNDSKDKLDKVDQYCFKDFRINWSNNEYKSLEEDVLAPGSTIKGIIAHTTLFHYLRLNKLFADTDKHERNDEVFTIVDNNAESKPSDKLEGYYELFGCSDATNPNNVKSGVLRIQDAKVDFASVIGRMHVKLDRFTGGAINGALFSQEKLYEPAFDLHIEIRKDRYEKLKEADPMHALEALECAIKDIKEGFVSICAGSGRDTTVFELDNEGVQNND